MDLPTGFDDLPTDESARHGQAAGDPPAGRPPFGGEVCV